MNLSDIAAQSTFNEVAVILMLAAMFGIIGQLLRQPLIVMFIALGVAAGPSFLDIVHSKDNIHLLAELGIAILLFIVGLKLDVRIIRSVGRVSLLTGLGQVVFTSLIGYLIGLLLGMSSLESFYVAVALTFSSTIIIVKLLSDKKEIDSLHGQIALGFLIVQDIVVILVMIILSYMRLDTADNVVVDIGKVFLSGFLMLAATFVMMKWIIPRISNFLGKSLELLTLFAVAWSVSMALIGKLTGFSAEVGAFLAGVSLASSDFKDLISSRMVSLRDFLLLFFFVNLGASIDLSLIGNQLIPALIFSIFVLIGNPIIVMIIMGIMGYKKRTSFLAGLTVAQISEFSLIFAGLGLSIGHITEQIVGLITLVGLITIGLSTYMILYSHQIFNVLAPALQIFEREIPTAENLLETAKDTKPEVIILGMGRFGQQIADILDQHQLKNYLAIDHDPSLVKEMQSESRNIIYGDIDDPEIFEHIDIASTKFVINTIPVYESSEYLVKRLRRLKFKGKFFAVVSNRKDAEALRNLGVDEILEIQKLAAANFFNRFMIHYFGQGGSPE